MKKSLVLIVIFTFLGLLNTFGQEIKEDTCALITKETDEFTGEVTYSSPISDGSKILDIGITKVRDKKTTVYYLSLDATGSTLNTGERGVFLIFEDGTRWKKDVKISVRSGSENWRYSAFIRLTPQDIGLFSKKKVKKFRLYIYDNELSDWDSTWFLGYVRCIKKSK
jgi:hypothetical protein